MIYVYIYVYQNPSMRLNIPKPSSMKFVGTGFVSEEIGNALLSLVSCDRSANAGGTANAAV